MPEKNTGPEINVRRMRTEALQRFNTAFGLMTIIPLLICIYLVTVKLFSIEILVGPNAVYFLIVVLIGLLGLLYGRTVILGIVARLAEEIEQREKAQRNLRAAQDQLIQAAKMESVGQLAAGAAHEMKNPLSIVQMGLDYLKDAVDKSNDKMAFTLSKMESAVRRADGVVRGLLDYASLSDLEPQEVDLKQILENALGLVVHETDKRKIQIEKAFSDIPAVWADSNRLEQVFVNLFSNAAFAMPGGGTLTVRASAHKFDSIEPGVGRRTADNFRVGEIAVAVEIEDMGHGIPQDVMGRIFDPFFTTRRSSGGTGLGLPVVKNIIDIHRGLVTIRNKPEGGGVIVRVLLKTQGANDGGGEKENPDR